MRPSGFSQLQRQFCHHKPLLHATRHVDLDWIWECYRCKAAFLIIEEKYRPHFSIAESEWAMTRRIARELGIPALAVGWWNDAEDSEAIPERMWVRAQLADGTLTENKLIAAPDLFDWIVESFGVHQCEGRAVA